MNKWTFSKLLFEGWVHEEFESKEEAVSAGKMQFSDQSRFFVGRLAEMAAHQVVVDTEAVNVN